MVTESGQEYMLGDLIGNAHRTLYRLRQLEILTLDEQQLLKRPRRSSPRPNFSPNAWY